MSNEEGPELVTEDDTRLVVGQVRAALRDAYLRSNLIQNLEHLGTVAGVPDAEIFIYELYTKPQVVDLFRLVIALGLTVRIEDDPAVWGEKPTVREIVEERRVADLTLQVVKDL